MRVHVLTYLFITNHLKMFYLNKKKFQNTNIVSSCTPSLHYFTLLHYTILFSNFPPQTDRRCSCNFYFFYIYILTGTVCIWMVNLLDFLNLQAWGKRLLDFLGFLLVGHDQGIQETRATNLELGVAGVLLYLDGTSIGATGLVQEIFNFFDFTGHL